MQTCHARLDMRQDLIGSDKPILPLGVIHSANLLVFFLVLVRLARCDPF